MCGARSRAPRVDQHVRHGRPSRSASASAAGARRPHAAACSCGGELRRAAEGHRTRHVLGAGPDAELLAAAVDDRLDRLPVADDECADSLRGADLVAGDGEQRAGQPLERHGHLAEGLHRVGVEGRHPRRTPRRDLGHRLDHADFVVDPHDGDHGGMLTPAPGRARRGPRPRSRPPAGSPPAAQVADGVGRREDRLVLDGGHGGAHGSPRSRAASAAPRMPRLSASVPPEVKITWFGSAPTAAATSRRACSRPARAVRPNRWPLEGFPKAELVRYGSMASSTSGRTGVVAE